MIDALLVFNALTLETVQPVLETQQETLRAIWKMTLRSILPSLTRLQHRWSPEPRPGVFAVSLRPGEPQGWAATRPVMTRQGSGVCWSLKISVPHEDEVRVDRYPTCLAISIPKPGARLDTLDTLELLRRTIPLNDSVPDVDPRVELTGNALTITLTAPDVVPCDFAPGHPVLSVQLK